MKKYWFLFLRTFSLESKMSKYTKSQKTLYQYLKKLQKYAVFEGLWSGAHTGWLMIAPRVKVRVKDRWNCSRTLTATSAWFSKTWLKQINFKSSLQNLLEIPLLRGWLMKVSWSFQLYKILFFLYFNSYNPEQLLDSQSFHGHAWPWCLNRAYNLRFIINIYFSLDHMVILIISYNRIKTKCEKSNLKASNGDKKI